VDDLTRLIDDVRQRARPAPGAFERLEGRRRRRARRRRATALVAAFVVGAVSAGIAVSVLRGLGHDRGAVPATQPLPEGPLEPGVYEVSLGPSLELQVGSGWVAHRGAGHVELSRDAGDGGRIEFYVWNLESLRPLDPDTGAPAPLDVPYARWFRDVERRAVERGLLPDLSRLRDTADWRYRTPEYVMWLLSFGEPEEVEALDPGVGGRTGWGISFVRSTAETVAEAADGSVVHPAGLTWAFSPTGGDLHLVIGYTLPPGADDAPARELVDSIELPPVPSS